MSQSSLAQVSRCASEALKAAKNASLLASLARGQHRLSANADRKRAVRTGLRDVCVASISVDA